MEVPLSFVCSTSSSGAEDVDHKPKRTRLKLTHLSQEEKMQRRKLKNRVAAQSARDRKREKMSDMEVTLKQLQSQIASLAKTNEALRRTNSSLATENEYLKKQGIIVKSEPEDVFENDLKSAAVESAEQPSVDYCYSPTSSVPSAFDSCDLQSIDEDHLVSSLVLESLQDDPDLLAQCTEELLCQEPLVGTGAELMESREADDHFLFLNGDEKGDANIQKCHSKPTFSTHQAHSVSDLSPDEDGMVEDLFPELIY